MLYFYFLSRYYRNFIFYFACLSFIFAISDLFLRLPLLPSIHSTPKLIWLMLPLMAQFAVPIASAMAVSIVMGNLYIEDEIIFYYYFASVRKTVQRSVLIFSTTIIFLYIPLIFIWAPQSYKKGKEFILSLAKEQFYTLEANKFHNPFPRFNFFFKEKEIKDNKIVFKKLILMFIEKDGSKYLVNAQGGCLDNDILNLNDGSIQNVGIKKSYFLNFKTTEINLKKFFESKSENNISQVPIRFLTFKNLTKYKGINQEANVEFFKRISQVLWQFLVPFLALFFIIILGKNKSNLLISVGTSGFIFLVSYINVSVCQALHKYFVPAIIFLFLPVLIFFFVLYFFYSKKR